MASEPPSNNPTILSSPLIAVTAANGTAHFSVHSATLLAHSPPLNCALTGPWKESTTQQIDLPDWDGPTVARFLQYLYIATYSSEPHTLLPHAQLYALADYKDVPGLRQLTLTRLAQALDAPHWRTPNNDDAATATTDAVDLIDYVYAHTRSGDTIRTVVCRFAVKQLECLMACEDMEALLSKGGDFTIELLRMAAVVAKEELAAATTAATTAAATVNAQRAAGRAVGQANVDAERIRLLEARVQVLEARAAAAVMSPAAAQRAAADRMSNVRRRL
ncbi:hypothetical protein P167DRAFT_383214 [Morchella conica CCBAS932]|uniref:BTB domain-containing protein n=1 Tax=Morchella conica CCBAS932 TaxID=1392247 RepID=A0A3N4KZB7_9PEZI|nr:hypothetical protein P167DRAFT_383214 [Morchella conica CCBAS932]